MKPPLIRMQLLAALVSVTACDSGTWTEGYLQYGFKEAYSSKINFENGGSVIITASASSTYYLNMQNGLSMVIALDDKVCNTTSINKPQVKFLLSSKCSIELTPGLHVLSVKIALSDLDSMQFTDDLDVQHNSVYGELRMIQY